jgi:ribosomal protein S18 acetylase RimI-like enzyme
MGALPTTDRATKSVIEVRLAPFVGDHAIELVPLWRESFEHGVGIVDTHSIAEQTRYLLDEVAPHNEIRVAFLGSRMAGFVAATPESIAQLYVRRDLHGRGIGTRLLEWAKAQSGGSLWLHTFARNTAARAFYERHGFTIVARGFEPSWQLDDLRYEWNRPQSERRP